MYSHERLHQCGVERIHSFHQQPVQKPISSRAFFLFLWEELQLQTGRREKRSCEQLDVVVRPPLPHITCRSGSNRHSHFTLFLRYSIYTLYTSYIECIDLKWILQLFLNLRNDDGSITFEHSRLDSIIIISTHHRRLELSIEWNNERKLSEIFHLRTHSSPLFQHCIAHHIFLMCHSDDLSLSSSESLSTLRFCKPHKLVIFSVVYKSATKSSKYEFCVK